MTRRVGIDNSILVRLATGDPAEGFAHCVHALTALVEGVDTEVLAPNQVIGEAYVALQHHYGIPKAEARTPLASVLTSGLVAPPNGPGVPTAFGGQYRRRPARAPDRR